MYHPLETILRIIETLNNFSPKQENKKKENFNQLFLLFFLFFFSFFFSMNKPVSYPNLGFDADETFPSFLSVPFLSLCPPSSLPFSSCPSCPSLSSARCSINRQTWIYYIVSWKRRFQPLVSASYHNSAQPTSLQTWKKYSRRRTLAGAYNRLSWQGPDSLTGHMAGDADRPIQY